MSELLGGRALGVDEIHLLMAVDAVEVSRLAQILNAAWRSRTVALQWQTGVVVPIFKKRGL